MIETKLEFILEGLVCSSCSSDIEKEVLKISGIDDASINFLTKKLTVLTNDKADHDEVFRMIKQISKNTESSIKVLKIGKKSTNGGNNNYIKIMFIKLSVALALYISALIIKNSYIALILYTVALIISGYELYFKAFKNIIKGKIFDEKFLMMIATAGAFVIKEFAEGAAVMIFFQIGELLQMLAVDKSRRSIESLINIKPVSVNLKIDNKYETVNPASVPVGSIILAKPGDRIAIDGKVFKGDSIIDTSSITGESIPLSVSAGDKILSGTVNLSSTIEILTTEIFENSTVSRILKLVENASERKARTENFITKFAAVYTPIVVILALLISFIPPLLISGASFYDWIYRGLLFLVISCPCALVISIPLGFFGGLGAASANGVLIKGANYLEAIKKVKTVIFDKTGTLTKGIFEVVEVLSTENYNKETLIELACYGEYYSNHPLAKAIVNHCKVDIDPSLIKKHTEFPGMGSEVHLEDKTILIGNKRLMDQFGVFFKEGAYQDINCKGSEIFIAIDGVYAGTFLLRDNIKEDAQFCIDSLKSEGVKEIVMLTGDNKNNAKDVADKLGINKFYSNLLPEEKVILTEKIKIETKGRGVTIFVGDGINDAPVLSCADVGVSMGGLGSDAAIESSDIVIVNDNPAKLVTAIRIAKKTGVIVMQNIILALSIKAAVLVLGAGGLATMWEAVFADVGVTILAVFNSMRILRAKF